MSVLHNLHLRTPPLSLFIMKRQKRTRTWRATATTYPMQLAPVMLTDPLTYIAGQTLKRQLAGIAEPEYINHILP